MLAFYFLLRLKFEKVFDFSVIKDLPKGYSRSEDGIFINLAHHDGDRIFPFAQAIL